MSLRLTETLALLPEARRFVAEGERLMSEQRDVVQTLERDGYDTLDAIEHLELLEGMQAEYLDHLEKLERRVLVLVRPEKHSVPRFVTTKRGLKQSCGEPLNANRETRCRFRKHEDKFNARVMTTNFEVAAELCCECVYQSHSQAFA